MLENSFQVIAPAVTAFDPATRLQQRRGGGLRIGDALQVNDSVTLFYTLGDGLLKVATAFHVPASRGV
ncbi:MAG TPA: hypothetical protein VHE58_07835 [Burkholderiales bacterium]|nr:hypothetical protein [Burkholderiales bacterium]